MLRLLRAPLIDPETEQHSTPKGVRSPFNSLRYKHRTPSGVFHFIESRTDPTLLRFSGRSRNLLRKFTSAHQPVADHTRP